MQKIQPSLVVLISGNGSNLQAIMEACDENRLNAKIQAVISSRDNAFGLTRAKNANIPTFVIDPNAYGSIKLYEQALIEHISIYKPSLIVLAGFMRVLSASFVQHYSKQILNIHPSLLPKFKGLDTHQRAIDANEKMHGCTVHFVTKRLDAGEIIMQAAVPILPKDDAQILAKRVQKKEHEIYPQAIAFVLENSRLS